MNLMPLLDRITMALSEVLAAKGKASLALSGGSSPVALYQSLSRVDLDWASVTVTLIDDRLVPSDHPDSNHRLIKETLLQDKAAAATFIPLDDWSADNIPDIAVLGMGTDGHFASLFPAMLARGEGFDPDAAPAILTTEPLGNPEHPRITMSLSMILAIPDRVLMVIGNEKQAVLAAAQSGQDLPITRLLAHDGRTNHKTGSTAIVTERI